MYDKRNRIRAEALESHLRVSPVKAKVKTRAAVTHRCILLLKGLGGEARHVVYDGSKVGRPVEANVGEAGGVGLGDAFHTFRREAESKFSGPPANCLPAVS